MSSLLKVFLLLKLGIVSLVIFADAARASEAVAQNFLEVRSLESRSLTFDQQAPSNGSENQTSESGSSSTLGIPGDWTPINNWLSQHNTNQLSVSSRGNINPQMFGNPPERDYQTEVAILIQNSNKTQNTCMNQCSNNGVCYQNQCYCHAGYVSADCSIKTSEVSQDGMTSAQVLTLSTVTYFAGISFGHMLILYLTRKADEQEFMDIKPYLRPS